MPKTNVAMKNKRSQTQSFHSSVKTIVYVVLLLLLLTPNEILKKTENRVLLSVSE